MFSEPCRGGTYRPVNGTFLKLQPAKNCIILHIAVQITILRFQ